MLETSCGRVDALSNPKTSISFQKRHYYTGNVNSETSGESRNALLHCGDVLAQPELAAWPANWAQNLVLSLRQSSDEEARPGSGSGSAEQKFAALQRQSEQPWVLQSITIQVTAKSKTLKRQNAIMPFGNDRSVLRQHFWGWNHRPTAKRRASDRLV